MYRYEYGVTQRDRVTTLQHCINCVTISFSMDMLWSCWIIYTNTKYTYTFTHTDTHMYTYTYHIQIHIHNYINIYVHLYPLTEYLQPNYPKSCVYARIIYLHSRCELLSKPFRHNWPPASVSKRSSRSLSNGVKLHAITSLQKIGSSN